MLLTADISSGTHDFGAFKAAGGACLIIKTGDGLGDEFVNKQASDWARRAREAGLATGFYHYNHPRRWSEHKLADEIAFEGTLIRRAGPPRPGEPRVWLDVEAFDKSDALDDYQPYVTALRSGVADEVGHDPVLYTFLSALPRFGDYDGHIILAWFGKAQTQADAEHLWPVAVDEVRKACPRARLVGWQFAGDVAGGVAGLSSCDLSVLTPEALVGGDDEGIFGGLDPAHSQESDMPALFWHEGALYLLLDGHRSASGLQAHTCDRLIAAGAKVIGAPGDACELFDLLRPL